MNPSVYGVRSTFIRHSNSFLPRPFGRSHAHGFPRKDFKLAEDQKLVQDQDAEFEQAQNEAHELQKIEATKQAKLQEELEDSLGLREAIRKRAVQIPEEPATGVQIAICFPDQRRVVRKFDPTQNADDVLAFVANQEQMFDTKMRPRVFSLVFGAGNSMLDTAKTLSEQGIKGRTMMRVVIEDDE
jgi:hypothetical protein